MPGDKIDVRSLRSKAGALAQLDIEQGRIEAQHWDFRSDEHFARLVMEHAARACDHLSTRAGTADECADAIRGILP